MWTHFAFWIGGSWGIGLDCFFVVHSLLHILLRNHPKNEFRSRLSWVLILGAAIAGSIDLLIRAVG